jgi:hypothetical protein
LGNLGNGLVDWFLGLSDDGRHLSTFSAAPGIRLHGTEHIVKYSFDLRITFAIVCAA